MSDPSLFGLGDGKIKGSPTLDAIITKVHDRQDKWKTIRQNPLPMPQEITETAILGSFSYALQETHRRIIRSDLLVSVNGTADTPPSIARDYLKLKFGKAERVKHTQILRLRETYRDYPLLAKPQKFDEGFYIDIKSAYWSILQISGWRVDYYPGRWLMRGQGVRDFPFQDPDHRPQKIARHALVSSGVMGELSQWRPRDRTIVSIKAGNPLINSQLIGLVHDVLHSIAVQARRAGAIYTATDGYICPNTKTMMKVDQIIKDWGLVGRVKAYGPGEVYGPGAYRVGPVKSRSPARGRINNIKAGEYDKWLQPRFAKLAGIKSIGD